jgi:hypothetical protein
MNHHADKLEYLDATPDRATVNQELGGIVKEVHTCPGCGNIETQISPS